MGSIMSDNDVDDGWRCDPLPANTAKTPQQRAGVILAYDLTQPDKLPPGWNLHDACVDAIRAAVNDERECIAKIIEDDANCCDRCNYAGDPIDERAKRLASVIRARKDS